MFCIRWNTARWLSVTRFGKISPFWQNLKSLWHFLTVYLIFGIILNKLWQILYAFGQICLDVKVQKLKNNLAIWSHCTLYYFDTNNYFHYSVFEDRWRYLVNTIRKILDQVSLIFCCHGSKIFFLSFDDKN